MNVQAFKIRTVVSALNLINMTRETAENKNYSRLICNVVSFY